MHVFVNFKASKGFTMITLLQETKKHLESVDKDLLYNIGVDLGLSNNRELEWFSYPPKEKAEKIVEQWVQETRTDPDSKKIQDVIQKLSNNNELSTAQHAQAREGLKKIKGMTLEAKEAAAAEAQEKADKAVERAAEVRAKVRNDLLVCALAIKEDLERNKQLKKQTVQKLQPVKKVAQRLIEIFNFLSKSLRPHSNAAAAEDRKVKSTHEKYLEKIGNACNDLQNVIQKCENPSKGNGEVFTPKELAGEIQRVVNGAEFHALFISESTKTKLELGKLKELASKCTTKVLGMNTGKAKTALSAQIEHANILLKDLEKFGARVPAPATSRIISKLPQGSLSLKKIMRDCLTASYIVQAGRHINAKRYDAHRLIAGIQSKIGEIDREEERAREEEERERVAKEINHQKCRLAANVFTKVIIADGIDKLRGPPAKLGQGSGTDAGDPNPPAPLEAVI